MRRRAIAIGVGVVLLLLLLWLVHTVIASRAWSEYSGTIETREIHVGSRIAGRVTGVFVEEGQAVKAGTVLVRFECDALKASRDQAAAAVEEARANLERMERGNRPEEIAEASAQASAANAALEEARNGPRPQELDQAKADFAAAQADATNAESYYGRMEKLIQTDTISRQQFDDARDKRDAARQRAESARQRLALLEAGTRAEDLHAAEDRFRQAEAARVLAVKGSRREDIDAARGRLGQAEAQVEQLDADLREAELTAPADATVEVVSVRPGDLVPEGRIVISMLEASELWIKIYVPETDLARVHVGQHATVRVDSLGRSVEGSVEQIASQAEFLPRNVQTRDDREHEVFGVKVRVDNGQGALKSGMSATVRLQ